MRDESVFVVYYDAANRQQRTGVWSIRFRLDRSRQRMEILPAPGASEQHAQPEHPASDELDVDGL